MDEYDLRTGQVEDWTALHALLVTCFADMDGRIDPPSSLKPMTPATLAAKAEEGTLLTLWRGGVLIGCGFATDAGDALYLDKLAILPAHRGRGLLRRMVARAEAIARAAGRDVLRLSSRVELTENHAAFAALGFVEVARTAHPGYDRPTSVTFEKRSPPA